MPLYANGTLIPENVANALTVNGVNITQVIANGVEVWTQTIGLTVGWSGNSFIGSQWQGVETSGFNIRASARTATPGSVGNWIPVNSSGTFTGNSFASLNSFNVDLRSSGRMLGLGGATWITYSPTTKAFSGQSSDNYFSSYYNYLETSSGLMRFRNSGGRTGAWVSLT